MKTWHKVVLIISSIVLGIGLLIGGVYLYVEHRYQQNQEYMVKATYSNEAKEVYKKWLKEIDPKAFTKEGVIHSYEIDKFEPNIMGGINVTLIINHDKQLECNPTLVKDSSTGKLEVSGGGYPIELDGLAEKNKKR